MIIDSYNDKKRSEREDSLTYAYLTAAWQRAQKMPSLKQVLEQQRPKEQQLAKTPEQMLAFAMRTQARLEGREE